MYDRGGGEVRHPVVGRNMPPKFLGGAAPTIPAGKDRREVLGQWLTSPDNPFFATGIANRIWAHFFGAGIIEPVDDIRVSNPPSNPELFQALGKKLTEYVIKLDASKMPKTIDFTSRVVDPKEKKEEAKEKMVTDLGIYAFDKDSLKLVKINGTWKISSLGS